VRSESVTLVAGVLKLFVLGLVPFSLFQLMLRAFYAMQDTRTPFWVNCGAVAVNTAVNVPMFYFLQVRGLAAGHALAYVFGTTLLARCLSRRIGGLDARRVGSSAGRIALASAGMGLVVWLVLQGAVRVVDGGTLLGQSAVVGVPIVAGVAAYLALAALFRVEELDFVRTLLRSRARRA
jgi:putative peptidoglycan lipid II flippase